MLFDVQNTGGSIFNILLQNLINIQFNGNSPNWVVKLYLIMPTQHDWKVKIIFINCLKNS